MNTDFEQVPTELRRGEAREPTHILVVEDEALNALYVASILEAMGYGVSTAANAEDALSAAGRHRPDLVLMDISLHGTMDGVDTACALQERFDVPIIFVTAHGDSRTRHRAELAQPVAFLTKPFSSGDLIATVENALEPELRLKA